MAKQQMKVNPYLVLTVTSPETTSSPVETAPVPKKSPDAKVVPKPRSPVGRDHKRPQFGGGAVSPSADRRHRRHDNKFPHEGRDDRRKPKKTPSSSSNDSDHSKPTVEEPKNRQRGSVDLDPDCGDMAIRVDRKKVEKNPKKCRNICLAIFIGSAIFIVGIVAGFCGRHFIKFDSTQTSTTITQSNETLIG